MCEIIHLKYPGIQATPVVGAYLVTLEGESLYL